MNCNDVLARAYDYFELRLADSDRAAVDSHVTMCPTCAALWVTARELDCHAFSEGCGELAETSMPDERRRVFERHMSICRACVEYLASYERTIAVARSASEVDETALRALEERLITSLLAARKRGS
jgi:anti-sigma factor RsiW